jgi:hypothetical protein
LKGGGGVDWGFISKYIPLYQKAAVLAVKIGLAGIAVAVLFRIDL